MTDVRSSPNASVGRRLGSAPWWAWLTGAGGVLLLGPVIAIGITHRDPDPLFMHSWWTPIAQAPTVTLLTCSIGLDLLLSTGLVAVLARTVRRRWRVRPRIRTIAAILVASGVALGWSLVAAAHADASSSAISTSLRGDTPEAAHLSGQAAQAIASVLAWPTDPTSHVHIIGTSSVPAGPWIVQTTEVLNENAQDEGADVVVETLVRPTDGHIDAAWFYGL